MSIAEKLIKIAENEPKVYEAGKVSQIQGVAPADVDPSLFSGKLKTVAENTIRVFEKGRADANLQKATASGEVIRVDDVSPIEHSLDITLSSDTVTDISGVGVTRYGRNLFNPNITEGTLIDSGGNTAIRSDFEFGKYYVGLTRDNNYVQSYIKSYIYDDNTFTFTASVGYYGIGIPIKVKPNVSFRARADMSTNGRLYCGFYTKDGVYISNNTGLTVRPVVTPSNCETMVLALTTTDTNPCTISNIQLEIGEEVTDYEPYKEPQTAFASADGKVQGLTSLSPTMTLAPDTSGVNINLEYYKDK